MNRSRALVGTRLWFGRHWSELAFFALSAAYLGCLLHAHRAVAAARSFNDTALYLAVAANDYASKAMWLGERPAVVPLIFKCCHNDPEQIRKFYDLLSFVGFSGLAWAVTRQVRSRVVGLIGALLVFSLSLSQEIVSWNAALLSESPSLSVSALCTGVALMFLGNPRRWLVPLVLAAGVLVFCRDSSAYFVLLLGALLGALLVVKLGLRSRAGGTLPYGVAGAAFLALFLASNVSANTGQRWQYSLSNVIMWRILADPDRTRDFVALGMPKSSALRAHRPHTEYDADPQLSEFRAWVETKGKRAYLKYLLSHPAYLLLKPLQSRRELRSLLGEDLAFYNAPGFVALEPAWLETVWARRTWPWRAAAVILVAYAVRVLEADRPSPLVLLGLVFTVLVYPLILVVWHGDAMEIARHGLLVSFQIQLAFVLLVVALADALALRFRFGQSSEFAYKTGDAFGRKQG